MSAMICFIVLLAAAAGAGVPPPQSSEWFPLDSTVCGIVPEATRQDIPKLTFNGTDFVTIWRDRRDRPASDGASAYAARVNLDGVVCDSIGVRVAKLTDSKWVREMACASSGSNVLVALSYDAMPDSDIIDVRRIGQDLVPLDSTPTLLSVSGSAPRVAYCGGRYLVAWLSESGVLGSRITSEGLVLDSTPLFLCDEQADNLELTSDSLRFFLVVQSLTGLTGYLIDTSGTVEDTVVIRDTDRGSLAADGEPQFGLSFGNGMYFVSFVEAMFAQHVLYGARVSRDGVVLDTTPIAIDSIRAPLGIDFFVTAAGAGVNLVVLGLPDSARVYCRRVSESGILLDTAWTAISESPELDCEPAVAYAGGEFVVVWTHEDDLAHWDIRYVRVLPDGTVLPRDGSVLSTAAPEQDQGDVASDGSNYLFVWRDSRVPSQDAVVRHVSVYGVLVSPLGSILEPGPFLIARDSAAGPRVCFGAGNYFVVWNDTKHDSPYSDIYGARVTPEGVVLDPDGIPVLCVPGRKEMHPAVAFDGQNYLAVCRWIRTAITSPLSGARVTPQGEVLDTGGFVIDSTDVEGYPELASNGHTCLVTYYRESGQASRVEGRFVEPDASVSDSFTISPLAANLAREPFAAASDAEGFYVAWSDSPYSDCFGTRVTADGRVLDTAGIPLGGRHPAGLEYNGAGYVLLRGWRTGTPSIDLSYVGPDGMPLDTCGETLRTTQDHMRYPRLGVGPDGQAAVVVTDFAVEPYNTRRVYGALVARPGTEEAREEHPVFSLDRAAPNPFGGSMVIRFGIPRSTPARLSVYSATGALVRTLLNSSLLPAHYSLTWNGRDGLGRLVPSGIYLYRLEAGNYSATGKVLLSR